MAGLPRRHHSSAHDGDAADQEFEPTPWCVERERRVNDSLEVNTGRGEDAPKPLTHWLVVELGIRPVHHAPVSTSPDRRAIVQCLVRLL